MNLIICTTPLQVLIATRIIAKFPQEHFVSVMLVSNINDKQQNYYDKLKKVSKKSYIFDLSKYKNKFLYLIFFLYCRYILFFRKNFSKIFLSSIDAVYSQAMLSSQNKDKIKLFTFDEGTANIYKNSMFYKDCQSTQGKLIYKLLGNKYSIEEIKKNISLHYTIYEGFDNIINNTEYVSLFNYDKQNIIRGGDKKEISIFLGQPIFDNDFLNIKYISKVIEELGIEFYFPHPRETFKIDGVKYIDTNLIFEEYFINEILPTITSCKYKIYTFFSSGLLNLVSLGDAVELVAIRFDEMPDKFSGIHSLFLQNGIKILDISK